MAARQKIPKIDIDSRQIGDGTEPGAAFSEHVIGPGSTQERLADVSDEALMAELESRLPSMDREKRQAVIEIIEINKRLQTLISELGATGVGLINNAATVRGGNVEGAQSKSKGGNSKNKIVFSPQIIIGGAEVPSVTGGASVENQPASGDGAASLNEARDPKPSGEGGDAQSGAELKKVEAGKGDDPDRENEEDDPRIEIGNKSEENDPESSDDNKDEKGDLNSEEDSKEKKEKKSLLEEVDPELYELLEESRENYARLSAEDRQKYIGRFLETDENGELKRNTFVSRLISKVPGVARFAKFINRKHDRQFQDAISQYDMWLKTAISQVIERHRANGVEAGKLEEIARRELHNQNAAFEARVVDHRVRMAEAHGGAGFLTKHWVNGGKFKKAMMVFGIGAVAGLTVGAGAAVLGVAGAASASVGGVTASLGYGTVAGAGAGMVTANQVTRRRSAAVYNDKNKEGAAGGRTVAEQDSVRDRLQNAGIIRDGRAFVAEDGDLKESEIARTTGQLIETTERSNREGMARNNRRLRTARNIGAVAGGLGGWGGHAAVEWVKDQDWNWPFGNESSTSPEKTDGGGDLEPSRNTDSGSGGSSEVTPDQTPTAEAPATPELVANNFYVEHGHGFVKEINEWVAANGQSKLNSAESWNLYKALRGQFGDNGIITELGTYVRPQGDLGIAAPGNTSWAKGVPEFLYEWLDKRSLWG